jgi:hypothetical protein
MQCVADDDFDTFFRLHKDTLTRKGAMGYLPREQFARFFDRLSKANLARIFTARMPDGRAAATQLVLMGPYPCAHTVCAGGDPELSKLGAHAFLRWRVFEQLSALGYKANDLTDAALNSVTHFKSQLGGDLVMSHVLTSPRSPRFAAADTLGLLHQRARGIARRIVKGARG